MLGQRTMPVSSWLQIQRYLSIAQQNTTVSFPANELRPDFTSPLARKEAKIFPHLGMDGASEYGLCSIHMAATLIWILGTSSIPQKTWIFPAWRENLSSFVRADTVRTLNHFSQRRTTNAAVYFGLPRDIGPSHMCKNTNWCGRRSPWLNGVPLTELSEQNKHQWEVEKGTEHW